MAAQGPRTEFSQALRAIAQERGLDADIILDTIKQAYVAAYKRDAREQGVDVDANDYDAEIDNSSGEAKIFGWPLEAPEERADVTPPGFGRIAAQTAKQVIHQKIREAEKGVVMDEYGGRVGSLISGTVLRFDGPNVRVDLGKTEGLMPAEERIPTEHLSPAQRLTFLIKSIEEGPRGKQIILSRADPELIKKIFAREVPEIGSGSVEIRIIAREPGARTKIAVFSTQPGVDPVGSCVGQKGVRVQAVTNELGGERVDIIPWSEDPEELIRATFSPVEITAIKLNKKDKTAIISVPVDQLSLAIGKDGQNIKLAGKITDFRIEAQEAEASEVVEK
jgi:N utilization substance protein A